LYKKQLQPAITLLTQKARLTEFQADEIIKLKESNGKRQLSIDRLKTDRQNILDLIREGGPQLDKLQAQLKQAAIEKENTKSRKPVDRGPENSL